MRPPARKAINNNYSCEIKPEWLVKQVILFNSVSVYSIRSTPRIPVEEIFTALAGLQKNTLLCIPNKIKCFYIKSGCVVWVAKHSK